MIKLLVALGPMCLLGRVHLGNLDQNIPITLQTLLILLPAVIFGWRVGLSAVIGYLVLGGVGLPVFANGSSGWSHFEGATGGCLIAFAIAAFAVGVLAEMLKTPRAIMGFILLTVGHLVIQLLGYMWMSGVGATDEPPYAFLMRTAPPSFVKVAIGTLVIITMGRIIDRRKQAKA
ncbi:MAG: biotin transporter BioY [Flavobacteriales bacterium]|nr:biotin transporter BioY [Flavobacteriales bacterium]